MLLISAGACVLSTAAGASFDLSIEVRRREPGDRWSAHYALDEPRTRLVFPNRSASFRAGVWKVAQPELELVVDEEGSEVLRRTDGAPFREVDLEFPTQPGHLDRNYEFHVPFTDGGVLLYAGHFQVSSDGGPLATELVLRGREGESLWHEGRRAESFTLTGEGGFRTYVYFGEATPIETDDVVGLIDPGLPAWIREASERYLPQLFALYAERFDHALPKKPMVFFSYAPGAPGASNSSGGALDGLIQMTVEGSSWREQVSADGQDRLIPLLTLLAHESIHLWNGPKGSGTPMRGAAWMHEGSADALAFRALVELGVYDRELLLQRHVVAMNDAITGLQDVSLRDFGPPQLSKNAYNGGSSLALATELAMQERDPALDLFDFWRELLSASRTSGAIYTEADYFALADRFVPGDGLGELLRGFVERTHENPAASLLDLFQPFDALPLAIDEDQGSLRLGE